MKSGPGVAVEAAIWARSWSLHSGASGLPRACLPGNRGHTGPNAGPGVCGPRAAAGAGLWDSGSLLPGLAGALDKAAPRPVPAGAASGPAQPGHLSAGLSPSGVGPQVHGHSQPDIEGPLL